jgi:glycosyltransferase involved in cell wall biosynthesis
MNYLDDDFILVLIGPGDFNKYIELIKSLNLEQKVFNFAKIENNRLPEFYNIADVVCVPSRWEGFGLVFVEAASCLTKIVTSNIAPMKEYLINDGVMNVLVDDYENPNSLKEAIIKLISKGEKNDNTRRQIIEIYDVNKVSQKEIDFYKKIKYRNIRSRLEYKKWYFDFWAKKEVYPVLRRILKLPKRVWLRIR